MNKLLLVLPVLLASCAPLMTTAPVSSSAEAVTTAQYKLTCKNALSQVWSTSLHVRPFYPENPRRARPWPALSVKEWTDHELILTAQRARTSEPYFWLDDPKELSVDVTCTEANGVATLTLVGSGQDAYEMRIIQAKLLSEIVTF